LASPSSEGYPTSGDHESNHPKDWALADWMPVRERITPNHKIAAAFEAVRSNKRKLDIQTSGHIKVSDINTVRILRLSLAINQGTLTSSEPEKQIRTVGTNGGVKTSFYYSGTF
jgi:hypothetical protein